MQGNKGSQLYTYRDEFVHVLTMRSKAGSGDSMGNVVKDIGIIDKIHCYNALEQVRTNVELVRNSRKYNIHVSTTEPYSP